jgi:hypothetical protein
MRRRFVPLIVLSAALSACAGAAQPATPAVYGTIVGYTEAATGHHISELNIRDAPSGHGPFRIVATVKEGTQVQLLDSDDTDALVIAPDGTQGYISVEFITQLHR